MSQQDIAKWHLKHFQQLKDETAKSTRAGVDKINQIDKIILKAEKQLQYYANSEEPEHMIQEAQVSLNSLKAKRECLVDSSWILGLYDL